jgi:hypothetical protein
MSATELKHVDVLDEGETIVQIIPFGNNSLACLTSDGRVLTPGPGFGEWLELPVPSTPPSKIYPPLG